MNKFTMFLLFTMSAVSFSAVAMYHEDMIARIIELKRLYATIVQKIERADANQSDERRTLQDYRENIKGKIANLQDDLISAPTRPRKVVVPGMREEAIHAQIIKLGIDRANLCNEIDIYDRTKADFKKQQEDPDYVFPYIYSYEVRIIMATRIDEIDDEVASLREVLSAVSNEKEKKSVKILQKSANVPENSIKDQDEILGQRHEERREEQRAAVVERSHSFMDTTNPPQKSASNVPKSSIKDQGERLRQRHEDRREEQRAAVVERRHSFMDTVRKYKNAIAATTATTAVAAAVAVATVASSASQIDCAQVAQAVCGGQVVSQTALQVCSAHIPNALRCFLGYF